MREIVLSTWHGNEALVVNVIRATCRPDATRHEVQVKIVPRPPGNIVISARRIAANTNGTNQFFLCVVKRQATAEHVNATNLAADHRIVDLTIVA